MVIFATALNRVFGTEVLKEGTDQLNKTTAATTTRLIITGLNMAVYFRVKMEVCREKCVALKKPADKWYRDLTAWPKPSPVTEGTGVQVYETILGVVWA